MLVPSLARFLNQMLEGVSKGSRIFKIVCVWILERGSEATRTLGQAPCRGTNTENVEHAGVVQDTGGERRADRELISVDMLFLVLLVSR